MNQKNTRRGFTQSCHAEFISASTPLVTIQNKEEILNQVQDDSMIRTEHAFTLIELLVVVLIIGILAAVAVPQYRKAVLKSRFHTLYPVAQGLAQAQESYYLGNGEYADDLAKLDVAAVGNATGQTVTLPKDIQVKLGVEDNHIYVRADKGDNALMIYQNHSPNFAGETHCEAKQDDTLANWLCEKGLEGKFVGNKFGYSIYALNTQNPNGTLGRAYRGTYATQGKTYSQGDSCTSAVGYCTGTYTEGSTCYANGHSSTCGYSTFDHSTCVGSKDAMYGCGAYIAFTNESTCIANGYQQCGGSVSYTQQSTCIANSTRGCGCITNEVTPCNSNSTKFTQQSICEGNVWGGCWSTDFTDRSICRANAKGACSGATYDSTSYCEGTYCPVGSPKQSGGTWALCEGEAAGGKTC